jgi:hypothetical protein
MGKNTLTNGNCFIADFEHIWLKHVLILKIMDFENVALTKIVCTYVIEGMNA